MNKPKILIVEDEPIVALRLRRQVEAFALSQVVFTGEEAISSAREFQPDLVLMDICLNDEPNQPDGIETVRRLKEIMDIPVIYITAHDEDEIVDRAKETEPYAYLLKPVSDRALHTTINLVLHRFRTDHDREQRNRVLAHTLKSIGDPLLITDSRGFITFGNHEAAHLLGLADDRFLGYTLNEAFQVESSTGVVCDVQHLVLDQGTVYHSRVGSLLRRRDDSTIPIHFCGAPVEDQERTLLGGVFIFHDVSRSEEIRDRLEQAVMDMRQKLAVLKPIPVRLPICPHCKKIRDENGVWYPVEQFLRLHTDAEFTHGPCPDCATSYHEKD